GLETVDHGARLRARAAVRLLDRNLDALVLLVLLNELGVHLAPELPCRIVGDVEELDRVFASASAGGDRETNQNGDEECVLLHGGLRSHSETAKRKRSSCSSRW